MAHVMTNRRRSELQLKQALKHEAAGDHDKVDGWLNKACQSEDKAVAAGESYETD